MHRLILACLIGLLFACSDSDTGGGVPPPVGASPGPTANPFVGTWSGSGQYTWQASGFPAQPLVIQNALYNIVDAGGGKVTFLLSPCAIPMVIQGNTANVVTGSTCFIDQGNGWTYDVVFTGGSAALSGTANLQVNATGTFRFNDNTLVFPPAVGSFYLIGSFTKIGG